jgi:hypothetical protein
VDDALLVRGLERVGELPHDRQRLVHRHGVLRDAVGERGAVHQLHDERLRRRRVLDAVDRTDVRMIQLGERSGLALEAGEPLRVLRQRCWQHLERDVAIQLGVAGAIHLAHSARANLRGDFVRAETCGGSERHEAA